ncbi:hypothetical protein [Luteolibacter sp. AS25]|uniref:hypothetical protein n=1 Tax=Luteolibacter sp. AS25 TaxID=3135776 RepID=UPI00398AB7A0
MGDHFQGEEDGVGFFPGTADAAAELVEIGEAEAIGSVDEDGAIRVRCCILTVLPFGEGLTDPFGGFLWWDIAAD